MGRTGFDNLINNFASYFLRATYCQYDIDRYEMICTAEVRGWVKMGHGAIVGLVRNLSENSNKVRAILDLIDDLDTPKLALTLLTHILSDEIIMFRYDSKCYSIPLDSNGWEQFELDYDKDEVEMIGEMKKRSKKLKARRERISRQSREFIAKEALKQEKRRSRSVLSNKVRSIVHILYSCIGKDINRLQNLENDLPLSIAHFYRHWIINHFMRSIDSLSWKQIKITHLVLISLWIKRLRGLG